MLKILTGSQIIARTREKFPLAKNQKEMDWKEQSLDRSHYVDRKLVIQYIETR